MSKVHFITQGCSANQADSEIMQGILKSEGHELTESEQDAELIVFNTCTVKGPTEAFFKKKLSELEKKNKKVIIAGCIPQASKNMDALKKHSLIGTYQVDKIAEVVNETNAGKRIGRIERENHSRLNLPKIRKNPYIEIVPILQGCLSSCTFCKTKHARGNAFSYSEEEIVRHISHAVREGAQEIWLTSQDNSVYGLEFGSNLAKLLKKICAIPRAFKIRVGMGNPKYMLPILDELIQVYKHEKIYKFLHVPLQSGSDRVLEDMNRDYTVEDFKIIVNRFRKEIPEMNIATDLICGFPTETQQDFEQTMDIVKTMKPDIINISRFWLRPGTPAAKFKQLPGRISKQRTRILTEVFEQIAEENNKRWIGWQGPVRIVGKGKPGSILGRNYAYKQIVLPEHTALPGEEINVHITSVTCYDLRVV